ncbi:MAG: DUF58 domain-containing protein [Candidatus Nanohaloarchaea archaeon]
MRSQDMMDREELRDEIDVEVKRVSDLFRFIMKFKRHFQPSGVEFSGLRQYLPSDDASRIDWKNSAGSDDLYVDQFEEEVDMDAFIVLDVSDSMIFGTADKLKSEYAAVVGAALAFASIDAGIDVGFGMWGEDSLIRNPSSTNSQYQRMLDELSDPENYGGKFDLDRALTDVIGKIKEDTAIFIISDFINVKGDWKTKLTLSSMKFRHVMSVMVRDLRDYRMPENGNMRFESPDGSGQIALNTDVEAEEFNREAKRREEEMEEKLKGSGSSFLKIDTRDNFAAKFAEFFEEDEGSW